MLSVLEIARAVYQRNKTKPAAAMTIREFATSGRVVRIRSTVLDCDVLLAADNADPAVVAAKDLPVYWAREFRQLIGTEPDELRLIHEVKVAFDGELVSDVDVPSVP
jgi:hypothetical protein